MIRPDLFRTSWPSVVRILAMRTGDLDGAEEAAAEAFARAAAAPTEIEELTAWCVQAGLRIWIDRMRRDARLEELIAQVPETPASSTVDDRLDLLAVVCDPALTATSQLALAMRVVLGLRTEVIAEHLGAQRSAVAARITRAKRELADAQEGFRIPVGADRERRRPLVVQCVASLHGIAQRRCLAPATAEVDLGLAALTLADGLVAEWADPDSLGLRVVVRIALARRRARVIDGIAVPFDEIDVSRVDRRLLAEGVADARAAQSGDRTSPWPVEAAIAVLYATAEDPARPDWTAIRTAHQVLLVLDHSPSRALAAAIVDAMCGDPDAARRIAELGEAGPSYVARDADLALADLAWRSGDRDSAASRYRVLLESGVLDGFDAAILAFVASRCAAS